MEAVLQPDSGRIVVGSDGHDTELGPGSGKHDSLLTSSMAHAPAEHCITVSHDTSHHADPYSHTASPPHAPPVVGCVSGQTVLHAPPSEGTPHGPPSAAMPESEDWSSMPVLPPQPLVRRAPARTRTRRPSTGASC